MVSAGAFAPVFLYFLIEYRADSGKIISNIERLSYEK